jgi:hypothetical protein
MPCTTWRTRKFKRKGCYHVRILCDNTNLFNQLKMQYHVRRHLRMF